MLIYLLYFLIIAVTLQGGNYDHPHRKGKCDFESKIRCLPATQLAELALDLAIRALAFNHTICKTWEMIVVQELHHQLTAWNILFIRRPHLINGAIPYYLNGLSPRGQSNRMNKIIFKKVFNFKRHAIHSSKINENWFCFGFWEISEENIHLHWRRWLRFTNISGQVFLCPSTCFSAASDSAFSCPPQEGAEFPKT